MSRVKKRSTTGARFADPECPDGISGYHQYWHQRKQETKTVEVHTCRLCGRSLGVNKETGKVRQRGVK